MWYPLDHMMIYNNSRDDILIRPNDGTHQLIRIIYIGCVLTCADDVCILTHTNNVY